jgi:hypothetical protein
MWVSGTQDPGSIPGETTTILQKPLIINNLQKIAKRRGTE